MRCTRSFSGKGESECAGIAGAGRFGNGVYRTRARVKVGIEGEEATKSDNVEYWQWG
jgi:hypothetical protein